MTNNIEPYKIAVWDLDETLGNFLEIGIFCDALKSISKHEISAKDFYQILDLYPEIFRPNILKILKYLKHQKNKKNCYKIIIYTNNQGPKEWANSIKNYLEYKLQTQIFDQIIAAYKIGGQQIEMNRRSHMKNVPDLLRCTHLPKNTKICFIDDQYHADMKHQNVSYIYLKAYVHHYDFNEMITRFLNCSLGQKIKDPEQFRNLMLQYFNQYSFSTTHKSDIENKVDKIISKQIMRYLEEFLDNK